MNLKYMQRGQEGFTLIEVMVSMLVASVVLLALAGMLTMAIRTNQQSEHRMDAVAKAQSIMANLSARVKSNFITQANAQAVVQSQLPAGSIYTPTITLAPSPVVSGPVRITVLLTWVEHGASKNVILNSQVFVP